MKIFESNPHKILTRLVALNVVLEVIIIIVWFSLPGAGNNLHFIGTTEAIVEAAIAVGLFSIALFGLTKKQQWGPVLVIAVTVAQRLFGTYVFFPRPGIIATLIWSIIIVYFGYRTIKISNPKESRRVT